MPLDPNHQAVQDAPIIQNVDDLGGPPGDYSDDAYNRYVIINNADEGQQGEEIRSLRSLHPYTRPLTISDLDSCIALENAAFDESERCSPDKVSLFLYVTCGSCSSPLLPLRRYIATYLLYYLLPERDQLLFSGSSHLSRCR